MKTQTLYVLTGGVVLLLLVAFATGVFNDHPSTLEVPELKIEAEAVTKLDVGWPGQTLTVERRGPEWYLTAPLEGRADAPTVRAFLEGLAALRPEAVLSTNPERHAHYGVDANAKTVTLTADGGETTRLTLGKAGPDRQSVYLRLDDDPRVLLAKGQPFFPTSLDAWRDKTLFSVGSAADVQHVLVEKEEKTFEVFREAGRWQVRVDGQTVAADSAAVARWLSHFAPLQSDGFLPDLAADQVREGHEEHLAFTLADGTQRHLWTRIEGKYIAAVTEDSPTVYRFFGHNRVTLYPSSGSLKAKD